EGFFHRFKHAERRRSGRALLTQDLEQLPAAAVLAFNYGRRSLDRMESAVEHLRDVSGGNRAPDITADCITA
ncbi:MAG: hypothetical protein AABZ70_03325, partial [candidate division NC10 bacterium]